MADYNKIVPIATHILKKYDFCDQCLGRFFSKQLNLSSNKLLGKKLQQKNNSSSKCYVCKNFFDHLHYFVKMMLDSASGYSFDSFGVGAMVKPSVVDRDDLIRSEYKLKGIDGIKTDITKELGKSFSRKTKKVFDYLDPDVTFTFNLRDDFCQIRSKSIVMSGRYTKTIRGFSQKQKSCSNCSGKGCRTCGFHGISEFDSVEGVLSSYIFEKFEGTTVNFSWIGGEDKSSLVLGNGRPFFAKINNPKKRCPRLPKIKKFDSVLLYSPKIVKNSPKKPLKFISSIEIKIRTDSLLDSNILKKLKSLTSSPVVVYEKSGKRSEKIIHSVKYKKTSKNSLSLFIIVDSGLPVKRFVNGDDVSPNISQILDNSCLCHEFDFLEISLNNNN